MLDLLLLAAMFVVCGGIGLPIARLLPARFAWREALAPTLGYAVLAVAVPVTYKLGVSMTVFFYASAALGLASLALHVRRLRDVDRKTVAIVAAICAGATLVMLAPRWIGGDQFAVFQGNQWDTYGYLESAVVFGRKSYAYVAAANDDIFTRYPLVAMAQGSLYNRPSVHQLFAVFSRIAPGEAYRLYYPFLVFSFSQVVLVSLVVLRGVFPAQRPARLAAVALAFPLGFWGQYVLDINAWSQIGSTPVLLAMFALALDIGVREEPDLRSGLRIAAVLAVVVAGALFLYPEGWIVYVAACGPLAGVPVLVRLIRTRRVASIVPMLGFLGVASAILYMPTWDFLVSQVTRTSSTIVPWWDYFQGFFFGRDAHAGSTAIDSVAGFVGLYFATPTPTASVPLLQRITIVVVVLGLVTALGALLAGRFAREGDTRTRIVAWTIGAVLLLAPAAWLFHKGNYWPAGKCVSYASPVFTLLLCLPVAVDFRCRWLRAVRWIAVAFVAFQLLTGFVRIHAAKGRRGIHYKAPYPAIQDVALKKELPWDLAPLEDALSPSTKVLVQPMDVWMQSHLSVFLYARGIPFALAGNANTYFGAGRDLGARPPPFTPDVEIAREGRVLVVTFRDGRALRIGDGLH